MNLYAYCGNNPTNFVDPYGENFIGGMISMFAGNGFDPSVDMGVDEVGQVSKEFGKGAIDGSIIVADAYTFGLIGPLNRLADEKVCENGAFGKASRIAANISAETAYMAAGDAVLSKFSLRLANSKYIGKGSKLFGRGGKYGYKGNFNRGKIRTGWGWKGTKSAGRDVFRTSWSSAGNRSSLNHIDWF